ncbi:MAG TPA: Gfo/Idh/MocA family oxidoreductase, partial [Acholeplasma sp.]|nr:Gfo/Idh/MocA family oxidoreductase [Acholeplasma sp.]
MKKVSVAIIGFGMAGRYFHLMPLLENKDFDVKVIMTRNIDRQKEIKESYPSIKVINNYEEILNDKTIDLLVIATSNDVHYEYTKKALNHNKHVICEK